MNGDGSRARGRTGRLGKRVTAYMAAGLCGAALTGWCVAASGQVGNGAETGSGAGADAKRPSVGSYSLVTTVFEPSEVAHLLNPAPTIEVTAGTEKTPTELTGEKAVPAQYVVEKLGNPWYECVAKEPKLRSCEALDRAMLTIRDANTIGYHIVSHGGPATLTVNVEVHDLLPVSYATDSTEWHAKEVIFVSVPKTTPAFRFSSEVLMGTWNGEAVVFEVGKELPESAKKALEDLGVKQDLGDQVLYSFRVKEPGKPAVGGQHPIADNGR
jgi:hypothetical protein